MRPKRILEIGKHSAVVLRGFLDKDQQHHLKRVLERTKWHNVKTSKGTLRDDMMATFFAKHESSTYSWGKNKYLADNNVTIGLLAARLSRLCNATFNVASAIKYMMPNTRLPAHKDNEPGQQDP